MESIIGSQFVGSIFGVVNRQGDIEVDFLDHWITNPWIIVDYMEYSECRFSRWILWIFSGFNPRNILSKKAIWLTDANYGPTGGWWNSITTDAVSIRNSENLMNRDSGFQLSKAWDQILARIKLANGKNSRRNPQEEERGAVYQIPSRSTAVPSGEKWTNGLGISGVYWVTKLLVLVLRTWSPLFVMFQQLGSISRWINYD